MVQARTSTLAGQGRLPTDSNRSPLRGRTTWTIGSAWAPEDDPELDLDSDDGWYDEAMEADIGDLMDGNIQQESAKPKARRSQASVSGCITSVYYGSYYVQARPHLFWKTQARQSYLEELIRWEGRGDYMRDSSCPDCVSRGREPPSAPEFRCLDCFLPDLTCRECCVRRHRLNPLHIVEVRSNFIFLLLRIHSFRFY